jgi:uncharacterized protein
MISLSQIESEIKESIKAKDQVRTDVLRGLKLRVQNEQIAKKTKGARLLPESDPRGQRPDGQEPAELSEEEILALVKSEIKKRKEASESFKTGGRTELAEKEQKESAILEKFLPPQMPEEEIIKIIDSVLALGQFTAKDFGFVIKEVKTKAGSSADSGTIAKLLKEKLK